MDLNPLRFTDGEHDELRFRRWFNRRNHQLHFLAKPFNQFLNSIVRSILFCFDSFVMKGAQMLGPTAAFFNQTICIQSAYPNIAI